MSEGSSRQNGTGQPQIRPFFPEPFGDDQGLTTEEEETREQPPKEPAPEDILPEEKDSDIASLSEKKRGKLKALIQEIRGLNRFHDIDKANRICSELTRELDCNEPGITKLTLGAAVDAVLVLGDEHVEVRNLWGALSGKAAHLDRDDIFRARLRIVDWPRQAFDKQSALNFCLNRFERMVQAGETIESIILTHLSGTMNDSANSVQKVKKGGITVDMIKDVARRLESLKGNKQAERSELYFILLDTVRPSSLNDVQRATFGLAVKALLKEGVHHDPSSRLWRLCRMFTASLKSEDYDWARAQVHKWSGDDTDDRKSKILDMIGRLEDFAKNPGVVRTSAPAPGGSASAFSL